MENNEPNMTEIGPLLVELLQFENLNYTVIIDISIISSSIVHDTESTSKWSGRKSQFIG